MRSATEAGADRAWVNPRLRHGLHLQPCRVAGVGAFLPDQVLTNAQVGRGLEDDGEWILPLTGIRERRIAGPDEFTSDLAVRASLRALENAGVGAGDLDLILVATNTPDLMLPATACFVQAKLGAPKCPAFDLKAGGAGFLYALEIGRQSIASHSFETVLVVGAEKLSAVLDWRDRATCPLFGDGAGAVVLRPAVDGSSVLGSSLGANGADAELIAMSAGGSRFPASQESVAGGLHFLRMQGRQTFKKAVKALCAGAADVLRQTGHGIADIDCIILHPSNRRILEAFADRLGATPAQMFVNLERYGNTGAASIPIALAEAAGVGRVKPGETLLLAGFGSGLTWGATLIQW